VLSLLTSGYYGGEDRTKPAGVGKCSHGGPLDSSSPSSDLLGYFREGINKDTNYCDISPHSGFHPAAAAAAIAGTKQFVDDIKGQITFAQLKALLGAGPSLAFAIDTTGSMGSVISGVRSAAIGIVDSRLGTDEEPLQYVLSPFNDPFTGPVTATTNANVFKSAISSLFASGGGDCPELAMSGVYDALSVADEGGQLFLWTDASAKDAAFIGAVSGLATRKDIKVFPALFGSCSPIDPAYLQLATSTGGQVFFLDRGEAFKATALADLAARNNAVQLLSVLDTYASAKTYAIPVDSTLRRLVVSVSSTDQFTLPVVTLTRPDGSVVHAGDPGVTDLGLFRAVVLAVAPPAVGTWQLKVEASPSPTYVNASGESLLRFSSFKFTQPGGQPPHQGLFTIPGSPVPGQSLYAVAWLTSGFSSASFSLRRKDFSLVRTLALERDQTDARMYFGALTVPGESFLAYVNGNDSSGKAFQRVVPVTVTPQTILITPPAAQDLRPGKSTSLEFQVKNFGPAGTFVFVAADDKNFVSSVTPGTFALATGESINVNVVLTLGASVPIGGSDTLTALAQRVGDPSVHNNAALTLFVTGAAASAGKPNFVARVIKQERVSAGVYDVDVRFTNTGPGTAKSFSVAALGMRTLTGTGTVTYNTTLGPPLPLTTPNIDVGAFFTVRLTLNVPSTVKRFSITETGSVLDIAGASYLFSQAQALIPQ
jgi:hypothetical protein